MGEGTHMKMGLRIFLLTVLAACLIVSCHALPKTTEAVVPETQLASVELVDQVRHLPATEIINFLQSDDSQCRSVATALKAEVNTVIAADVTAYTALDTGATCLSSGQTEVDTAQTAANTAATELTNAQTAKTNAASAPVTMTVAFSVTNPTVQQFTSTTQWQAAVATYNQAVTTVAAKEGARTAAQTNLATAQGTQTTLVLRCQCSAKAAYTAAVASAKSHESSNTANWRKAEKLICALDKTEPCPSNFPGHATAPTLPNAVSSKTDNQCATNAPTATPTTTEAPTQTPTEAHTPCHDYKAYRMFVPDHTGPNNAWCVQEIRYLNEQKQAINQNSGTFAASSSYYAVGAAYDQPNTHHFCSALNPTYPQWSSLAFPTNTKVCGYKIEALTGYGPEWNPKAWVIQGSNDGNTWASLDAEQVTWTQGQTKEFEFNQ